MPKDPANQQVQCAKCGAQNPQGATTCQSCGAALLARPQADTRLPLVSRLLVSVFVGLLVLIVCTHVAYRQYCDSAIRYPQESTLRDIGKVVEAIEAYRQEKHVLPKSLSGLPRATARLDETGAPADSWRRPLHYWTDGTRYRITSYGYDGKPAGVGLDYDLSSDDLAKDQEEGWWKLPLEARATFRQFATDRGLIYTADGYLHGSGRPMFLTSILTGAVAFVLAFCTIGGSAPVRRHLGSLVLRLIVTAAATLFVGICLAGLNGPSAH